MSESTPETTDEPQEGQEPSSEPQEGGTGDETQEDGTQSPSDEGEGVGQTPGEGEVTGPTTLPDEEREAEGGEPVTDPGTAEAKHLSEKEIKKRADALANENTRHRERVYAIIQDDAADLIACPMCSHYVEGAIVNPDVAKLPAEVSTHALSVLGIEGPRDLKQSPRYATCDECGGEGETWTGAVKEGYKSIQCEGCGGTGYVRTGYATNGHNIPYEPPAVTGPTVAWDDLSSDPEVAHLRDRGFTVIPPVAVNLGG